MVDRIPGSSALNVAALVRYLHDYLPLAGADLDIEMLHGGRSNLTFRLSTATDSWVLRRPPLGTVAPSANDVRREYTVIRALAGSDIPVPEALHLCQDSSIIGSPFSVMRFVPGIVIRSESDAAQLGPRATTCARLLIEELARLHAIDPAAVGLSQFGRPTGYLDRQVAALGSTVGDSAHT